MGYIVAVDPGTEKCGAAVLDEAGRVHERKVVPRTGVVALLAGWLGVYSPATLVVGDRTGSKKFLAEVSDAGIREAFAAVRPVDEHLSSLEARRRYFEEHPPTGWRRLIPSTLLTPPEPFDDYVAVILAERFLARGDRRTARG